MVKITEHGRHVINSSPVPVRTCRVVQQCTLNLSRAETSSRWCGVVVRSGGRSSGVIHVTRPWFKITRYVAKIPRVAEQSDVNVPSLTTAFLGALAVRGLVRKYKAIVPCNICSFQFQITIEGLISKKSKRMKSKKKIVWFYGSRELLL
ncbi:uncharacterized protein TNCV_4119941 [Trichonephila clavipes]|nr:uncharacterized protein TNCV_4119941 [Trichonephila clavipes]